MNPVSAAEQGTERRRFMRVPYASLVSYRSSAHDLRIASCVEVGRGGALIETGAPLETGQHVLLSFPRDGEAPLEFKGRVAWTAEAGPQRRQAGIQVFHSEVDALADSSELLYMALSQAGAVAPLIEERPAYAAASLLTIPNPRVDRPCRVRGIVKGFAAICAMLGLSAPLAGIAHCTQ